MKLHRLLYLQGGKCFYCREQLPLEGASIDHVIPRSMGGDDTLDNVVACCKTLNQWFAALPPKKKIEIIQNWTTKMPCPYDSAFTGKGEKIEETHGLDNR